MLNSHRHESDRSKVNIVSTVTSLIVVIGAMDSNAAPRLAVPANKQLDATASAGHRTDGPGPSTGRSDLPTGAHVAPRL